MTKTCAELRDAMLARLEDKYDLIYVDYRDQLTDHQVQCLVEKGPVDEFWDDSWEWESEGRGESVTYIITNLAADLIREDPAWEEVAEDFPYSNEWEEVREAIEDRDEGNAFRQLAQQTPAVLMRVQVLNEDTGFPMGQEPPDAVDALRRVGLPVTVHNVVVMNSIFTEENPYWNGAIAWWLFAADVEFLYDLPENPDAIIEVTDPYLWIGNPWQGDGWVNETPFEGTIRIRRGDLATDKSAVGYSWQEVSSSDASGYRCELRLTQTFAAS